MPWRGEGRRLVLLEDRAAERSQGGWTDGCVPLKQRVRVPSAGQRGGNPGHLFAG